MKSQMKSKLKLGYLLAIAPFHLFVACGEQVSDTQFEKTNLKWIKSRTSAQYAYLTSADIGTSGKEGDPFIFGMNIIDADQFISSALNATIWPQKVQLKLIKKAGKHQLAVQKGAQTLMVFAVNIKNRYYEVDFASSRNDLKLQALINQQGGKSTGETSWLAEDSPTVLSILQDKDTVVVDLKHRISQENTLLNEKKSGSVTVRLFLRRQKALPQLASTENRSVKAGSSHNIGYFAGELAQSHTQSLASIQRIALPKNRDQMIYFYLKDFPSPFFSVAQQAVEAWNKAFGYDLIQAIPAPPEINVGDPRYNVIKWFNKSDISLGWAGIAKPIADPDSGLVMGGHIYIQGGQLLDQMEANDKFTKSLPAASVRLIRGTLGNATIDVVAGETPVTPFVITPDQPFESFIQNYYYTVIIHEVGHILGLRHNFAGSTELSPEGAPASVMDYIPATNSTLVTGPGSYDIAAIRWGYFGESPQRELPFCADEDRYLWQTWNCNSGDYGDPLHFVVKGLTVANHFLANSTTRINNIRFISPMATIIELALKLWSLQSDLSSEQQSQLKLSLPPAYESFWKVKPDPSLTPDETAIASKNLDLARAIATNMIADLKIRKLVD